MARHAFGFRPGDIAEARSTESNCSLPPAIPEGVLVNVVTFDHGYYIVDYKGNNFRVFMACLRQPPDAVVEPR